MKALKNLTQLTSKVVIYVPGTNGTSKKANTAKAVKTTARFLSELFGGATASKAAGYWVSEQEGLVEESTTTVYAFCLPKQLEAQIDQVVSYCANMKEELNQEAIGLEVNGAMYFV